VNFSFGDISRYILIITAIVATFTYGKYKHTPLKYIVYYLWYAVILEVIASFLWHFLGLYNVWWYNIGINIEILFYLYLFYQYIENKKTKSFILFGSIIYETFFLVNYLLLSESWNTYQISPFILGGFLVVVTVLMFLLEMFQSDKVLSFGKYLIFWIGLGLLFYNIIPMPFLIGQYFFAGKDYSTDLRVFMLGIQYIGNILMYFSFIYGFIWSSMNYKSL
jgi:hypothetical protein